MGFEDEVEQSVQRPCRQTKRPVQADMRTHLIHRLKGKYVRSPANIEGFADERCEHRSISEIMASMKMASMVMDPVTAPCSAP